MEPVAGSPSHNTPGEEIKDHGQGQLTLASPDIGDVGIPLLVRALG